MKPESSLLSERWDGRDTFTGDEVAKILGLSRSSAFTAATKGLIPSIRIGHRLIIPRRALERLLASAEPVA